MRQNACLFFFQLKKMSIWSGLKVTNPDKTPHYRMASSAPPLQNTPGTNSFIILVFVFNLR